MEAIQYIAVAMGLAWASGVNLYATIAVLGILGSTGHMDLPPELAVLTHEGVIAAAVFMYFVEFFADKIPGVDSGWDAIHTFIRIPAGAVIAAQAVASVSPEAQLIAFLLGGAVAASSHGAKAAARLAINTSPEPVTNWTASIVEDIAAIGSLWVTFNYPLLMAAFVIAFFIFALWITPKILRAVRAIFRRLAELLGGKKDETVLPNVPTPPPAEGPGPEPGAGGLAKS